MTVLRVRSITLEGLVTYQNELAQMYHEAMRSVLV